MSDVDMADLGALLAAALDPAGQGVEAVRPIRDDIQARTRGLLAELGSEEVQV
ncbi:hypothetical protein [Kitasatospora mediocidica]|uniref:hypothetical protein n=1 Tax=Kitasatospora mediocidica TaxID=58352 RepID=UPI0038BD9BD2